MMKLGGHETFYPRPGWLTKGLLLLREQGDGVFSAPETADRLGVGRNMSKAIGWWLSATGLATRTSRNAPLGLTPLGTVITERDPHMVRLGTWWLVHAAALSCNAGTSLPWFFSQRRPERCDRTTLIETLSEDLASSRGRVAAAKTIQREVAVIMQTWAVPVPRPQTDPEDNLGSPFHRLDLIRHLRATDRFERSEPTPAPPEALGLILSALSMDQSCIDLTEDVLQDISVNSALLARAGGMLGRSREGLLDLAVSGERKLGSSMMSVRTLAGERFITFRSATAATWARRFYDEFRAAGDHT
jgi:hypothetical protein